MSEPDRSRGLLDWLRYLASPVLFALAGALFLVLPVAEASCGEEDILVEACLDGVGVLIGEADVDSNEGREFPSVILRATELPEWLTALGIGVMVCAAGGVATAFIRDKRQRAVSRLTAALAGLVLAAATYFLAAGALYAALEVPRILFSTTVHPSLVDQVGGSIIGVGIVPALGLFTALAAVEVIRLRRLRAA
ncbi:hypothetical protein [Glycomyces harbinensis]|uniref:Uncharacterized protein n=1 Tax=Glycomyces harbinensis TaxID=58114 RepID=A0A1G6RI26_9ACTN|nr:hypothetical protein [Glycomyces harbinensis]SDD04004.1 hypothetical protein SAMN05216270_101492 [Glycomyces harbinensis]